MDAKQEPPVYTNRGAPELTYEEIRQKARRPVHTTNSCKDEFQCGSQIALTAACDVYEPSEVYSSVDGPNEYQKTTRHGRTGGVFHARFPQVRRFLGDSWGFCC